MSKDKKEKNCRLGRVGGQAVLEGIMMRSGENVSLAVRKDDGSIAVENSKFVSVRKKHKILDLPLIRGCVNMVEMLLMSYSTLERSAKMLGLDDFEEETKFDKWVKKTFGDKIMNIIMPIAAVGGVILAIALFVGIPVLVTKGIEHLAGVSLGWWKNLISGLIKITVFVIYMFLVSLMKDIRTTFEYHGAEHKTIACYEAGEELTPENAKKHTRFHARCGTSFIFVILIISIFISSIVSWDLNPALMVLLRMCLLPVIVGVSFEFLMYAGKHPNAFTYALSLPGLLMQRITTKEPNERQLEVAIKAAKCAMPDEFPEEYAAVEAENAAKEAEKEAKENSETENTDAAESDKAEDAEQSDEIQ